MSSGSILEARDALASRLEARVDEIVREILGVWRSEIPEVAALDAGAQEQIHSAARLTISLVIRAVRTESAFEEPAVPVIEELGGWVPSLGIPATALAGAYHLGCWTGWRFVREELERADVSADAGGLLAAEVSVDFLTLTGHLGALLADAFRKAEGI